MTDQEVSLRGITKRDCVLLAARLMSLFVILRALKVLDWVPSSSSFPPDWEMFDRPCRFVIEVIFAALLWICSPFLTFLVIPVSRHNEPVSSWEPRELAQWVLVAIGFLRLWHTISHGARLFALVSYSLWKWGGVTMSSIFPTFGFTLQSALVSFVLIFGARFLSFWFVPRDRHVDHSRY